MGRVPQVRPDPRVHELHRKAHLLPPLVHDVDTVVVNRDFGDQTLKLVRAPCQSPSPSVLLRILVLGQHAQAADPALEQRELSVHVVHVGDDGSISGRTTHGDIPEVDANVGLTRRLSDVTLRVEVLAHMVHGAASARHDAIRAPVWAEVVVQLADRARLQHRRGGGSGHRCRRGRLSRRGGCLCRGRGGGCRFRCPWSVEPGRRSGGLGATSGGRSCACGGGRGARDR
mmetsp:Transcript_31503/g.91101  ORF Transcript_31503/g.91101 Transcript_31503/m.91101 type:complete len:229 (+) Transcript_31503:278-964(+)